MRFLFVIVAAALALSSENCSVDPLLRAVARHNHRSSHRTQVVLTVGARNFLFPELHEPDWAGPHEQPYLDEAQHGSAYRAYIDTTVTRYRGSRLLYAWQVENEPLDYVGNDVTGEDRITASQLAWEIGEVHRLDGAHRAVTTTYDGLNVSVDMLQMWTPMVLALGSNGHPEQALRAGDALGLDLYLDDRAFRFAT